MSSQALLTTGPFAVAAFAYALATAGFFVQIVRGAGSPRLVAGAPRALATAATLHAAYVVMASFFAHVCPVHSIHFVLSTLSLVATGVYLLARLRYRIDALGAFVAPVGLTSVLGTHFIGRPESPVRLPASFTALHVAMNVLGLAFFLLAGGAATLYLVQERRLKRKRAIGAISSLPALDTLDAAVHRFLIAGFPLLTIGIVTGTVWAHRLEQGAPQDVMRVVFAYATWALFAAVLLLRAVAGWRGRRAAYGTLAGFACAVVVLLVYLVRPQDPRAAQPAHEGMDWAAPTEGPRL